MPPHGVRSRADFDWLLCDQSTTSTLPRPLSGNWRGMSSDRYPLRSRNEAKEAAGAQDAQRIVALTEAARRIFKVRGSVLVDKLKKFLEDNASPAIMEEFKAATTQGAKLTLLWTKEFDPPLTDVDLVKWDSMQGEQPEEKKEGKDITNMNAEELAEHLKDLAPAGLGDKLKADNVGGAVLLDLDVQDVNRIAGNNGAYRRWLRHFLEKARPAPQVQFVPNMLDSAALERAIATGQYDQARRMLATAGSSDIRDRLRTESAVRQRQAEIVGKDNDAMRTELYDRLRLGRTTGAEIAFLPANEGDEQAAMAQVAEIMAPKPGVTKHDAAYELRLEAAGYEKRHAHVLNDIPEGEDRALRRIDTVERLLRQANNMSEPLGRCFAHLRVLIRANVQSLMGMELGYLAYGGIQLAMASVKAFNNHFKPLEYDEATPDAIVAKVKSHSARRTEYLALRARINTALENAKRPLVIAEGARKTKKLKTGGDPWRPDAGSLNMSPHRDDGAMPKYYLLKVIRRQLRLKRDNGGNVGEECKMCCLYHPTSQVCDIFSFPNFRQRIFKDIWAKGVAAGALRQTEVEEWNQRPSRKPEHRVDSSGKCVTNGEWKHLRRGGARGP